MTNSTVSGNTAAGTNGGGGVYVTPSTGSTTLVNCTIAGNNSSNTDANGGGGGIRHITGTLTLTNTIVADNTTASSTPALDLRTTTGTVTNCLIESAVGHSITNGMNGNLVGMDPVLSPLASNGGPTQTQAIGCMSPARDAGTTTGAPATDQRGMGRDATPDIGAFEVTTVDCPLPGGLMVADTTNHRIQAFDGTVWSVIGVGTVGSGPGQFRLPEAVTFSPDGQTIYVADTGNNRVQFSTDAGTSWGDLATNGTATNQVKAPQGVALDSDGNLYVSDTGNGRVLRFDGGLPGLATILASNGIGSGQVRSPRGLIVDSAFRLFVTDQLNSRVLRIANASTVLTSTSGVAIATLGTALNKVNAPQGITIDSLGDVYVADTGNNRILRWRNANPNNSSTMALSGSLLGQVNQAEGVTVTQFSMGPSAGGPMLIVGDTGNNRIEGRFIPTGGWQLIGAPNGIGTGIGQFRAPSKIQ